MARILVLIICLILLSTGLHAQSSGPLHIKVTDYGFLTSFPALQTILDDYLKTVEADLNKQQPIEDIDRVIKSTANSTALSSRGIGTDHASKFDRFLLGLSLGAAADLDRNVGLKDQIAGIGGSASILLGTKLNKKTDLFFNVGSLSHSKTFDGVMGTNLDSEITTNNAGIHLRYNFLDGSGDDMWGWTGLNVSTGYEYNRNKLSFEDVLAEDVNVDLGGQAVLQGRLKGKPQYTITSETHTIPVEVFSAVNFLKFFSVFGGAGADFNFGRSEGSGNVKANAFSPLTCVSGVCTNLNLPQAQITGDLNSHKNVDPFFFRGFAGLQLNLGHVKLYGEVNRVFGTQLTGVNFG
ncbi:MAG: hypothetical protein ACJ76H_08785, partial [Bacteriovoracaceae bacterium]